MPTHSPSPKAKMTAKMKEAGLPYDYSGCSMSSALTVSGGKYPVIAFTEMGVYVGFHDSEVAAEVAKATKRKHGVESVSVITGVESF